MNAKPHVHEPLLGRRSIYRDSNWDNPWIITYGDTRVRVCSGLRTPPPSLVRRKTAKAIRRHDQGSVAAGQRERAIREAEAAARETVSAWGTRR